MQGPADPGNVLSRVRDAVLAFDRDLRVVHANDAACEALGRGREEILNARTEDLAEGEWARSFERDLRDSLDEQRVIRSEHYCEQLDGWVGAAFHPGPDGVTVLATLVTDWLRTQEARGLFSAVVEGSEDAIVTKSLDGTITSWNRGAERLFGYTADEALGRPVTMLVPRERWSEEREILARVQAGERVESFESVRLRRDGSEVDVSLTVSPLRDAAGRILGASKVARDISDRKRVEAALRDASRRKDEFLATLAHELRNPLAPIRNAVHLLSQAEGDPELLVRARALLERQTAQLARMIDDLIDVSRITSGRIELRRERVDVVQVIDTAVEQSRPAIDELGHRLRISLPSVPAVLDADPMRLVQVFANLLDNAARFTPRGGEIAIEASVEDGQVRVAVRDNGIGIESSALGSVFDSFVQFGRALDLPQTGLGIGLSLVRGVVGLHAGTVSAHSEGAGRGSTFEVRLPLAREAPAAVAPAPEVAPEPKPEPAREREPGEAPPHSKRILVVDDNQDAADSTALILELGGHDVRVAYDGPSGLEAFEEFEPDVALLDIGLPGLSGYDLAAAIRGTPHGRDAALIAATGWGQPHDKDLAFRAGFDAHMTKPLLPEALDALITELTEGKEVDQGQRVNETASESAVPYGSSGSR